MWNITIMTKRDSAIEISGWHGMLAILGALVAASVLVLQMRAWDFGLFRLVNGVAGNNYWLDVIGIFAAKWLIVLMAISLLSLAFLPVWRSRKGACSVCRVFDRKRQKTEQSIGVAYAAVVAGISGILAWASNQLFSLLILWRDRPFAVLQDVNQLIDSPMTSKSFPSDHSTIAFAIAFSLVFFRPRLGVFFLLAAIMVAWGRVFVGVHFPADVVAGAVVGCLWAFLIKLFESKIGLTSRICHAYERLCRCLLSR